MSTAAQGEKFLLGRKSLSDYKETLDLRRINGSSRGIDGTMTGTSQPIPPALLLQAAQEAHFHAYAPYSRFAVGCALQTTDEKIHTGCNIENISYSLTLCAERVAAARAVASGAQHFLALVVYAQTRTPISPCGACRQFLAEFAPGLPIWSVDAQGQFAFWTLSELLPRPKEGILDAAVDRAKMFHVEQSEGRV
jgi:cytidine deaminase